MPTQVQLCNLALDKVSEKPITTISDSTPRAEACSREYQPALDQILEEAFWNFAQARKILTRGINPAFGYDYSYTLPDDLVGLEIFNGADVRDYHPEALYKLEGELLLTNEEEANIVYTKNGLGYVGTGGAEDIFGATMTPLFVSAFTTLLASKVAPSVKNDGPAYASGLLAIYKLEVSKARTRGANMRKRQPLLPEVESRVIGSRRVSTVG